MIYSIQYLRGIAAILVLIEHIATKGVQFSNDPLSYYRIGGCGVDLFFIISGFIMCETTKSGTVTVKHFMLARFFRILPLYWTLTTAALFVFLISPSNVNRSGGETMLWQSYLLIPTHGKFLIQNAWTLSYEFFYYCIFCIGLILPRSRLITALTLLALTITGFAVKPSNFYFGYYTAPIILEFCYGIVAFEIWNRKLIGKQLGTILLLCGVIALLVVNDVGVKGTTTRYLHYGIPCLALTIGLLSFEQQLRQRPQAMPVLMGNASYSIYLVHPFVLAGTALILRQFNALPTQHPYIFVLVLFVVAVFAGIASFKLIEKPLDIALRPFKTIATERLRIMSRPN